MEKLQALISELMFSESNRGGENAYFNTNASSKYKLAFLTCFKLIREKEQVTIGDYVYEAIIGKNGRPYINRINKAVLDIELSDSDKELLEQFEQGVVTANEANKNWKEEHSYVAEETF